MIIQLQQSDFFNLNLKVDFFSIFTFAATLVKNKMWLLRLDIICYKEFNYVQIFKLCRKINNETLEIFFVQGFGKQFSFFGELN